MRGSLNDTNGSMNEAEIDPTGSTCSLPFAAGGFEMVSPIVATNSVCYRISYSSQTKERYFRRSKRKIKWVFGFTNVHSNHPQCEWNGPGEEHEVELVVKKAGATRIFWNKQDISKLFREHRGSDMADFGWKTRTDKTILVKAVRAPQNQETGQTFALFLEGVNFTDLPTLSQIETASLELQRESGNDSRCYDDGASSISTLSAARSFDDLCDVPHASLDYRLSMAGFNATGMPDAVVDELHSDVYSTPLDTMRFRVTQCLPQLEEVISKAIMDTFMQTDLKIDRPTLPSQMSSLALDVYEVEAKMLLETYRWVVTNSCNMDGIPEESSINFMQKQIIYTVTRIRDQNLPADIATWVILCTAAILGMEFHTPFICDTIILLDLPPEVCGNTLKEAFGGFGSVNTAAVTSGNEGFGFCRFDDDDGPVSVQQAVIEDMLSFGDWKPKIHVVNPLSYNNLLAGLSVDDIDNTLTPYKTVRNELDCHRTRPAKDLRRVSPCSVASLWEFPQIVDDY